jgi:hypothetical protein
MKTSIHNHASVILAYNRDNIVSNIYDNTYPKEIWRGRINLLGGGQSPGDVSPRYLLEREMNEEFRINRGETKKYDKNFSDLVGKGKGAPKIDLFASRAEIKYIKDFLLNNSGPWGDFLIKLPPYKDKPSFNVMFSSYICPLSDYAMNCFKKNIKNGKSLVSEGFLKITNLNDITSGKVLTAWATGIVLEDFFKVNVPNPENLGHQKLSLPKDSMQDYFKEYDYFIK